MVFNISSKLYFSSIYLTNDLEFMTVISLNVLQQAITEKYETKQNVRYIHHDQTIVSYTFVMDCDREIILIS